MRIQLKLSKEKTAITDINEIVAIVEKQASAMNNSQILISMDDFNDATRAFLKLKKGLEKSKVVLGGVTLGEVGHTYGLGGSNGWGITCYTDDTKANEIIHEVSEFKGVKSLDVSVNTQAVLELCDEFSPKNSEKYLEKLEEKFGCENGGNTYNHDNDLIYNIHFNVFSNSDDWFYDDDCIIALEVHRGGDVRGNYGETRFFHMNDALVEVLTGAKISFCLSNEITSSEVIQANDIDFSELDFDQWDTFDSDQDIFEDYFDFVSLSKDQMITVTCKKTGRIFEIFAQTRIDC